MLSDRRYIRGTWAVAAIAWMLLFAVASLSMDSDFNLEIPLSQSGHSFVGKIGKDPRQSHGGHREMIAAASWLHWAPSFHSRSQEIADPERPLVPHLLTSTIIRAPPSAAL